MGGLPLQHCVGESSHGTVKYNGCPVLVFWHMSYSQYFLPNFMDMGSLLGTILGTILNYKRTLMSTVKGPLVRLILTVAHMLGLR